MIISQKDDHNVKIRMILIPLVAALAACSGGGGGSAVPTKVAAKSNAVFTLTIPAASTSSAARRPMYVSSGTQSIEIHLDTVNGSAPTTGVTELVQNLTGGSPGCSGSPVTCSIEFDGIEAGTDVFTISLYSGTVSGGAPTGSVLSTASTGNVTITQGQIATVPLTLNGVIASLALSGSPALAAGTSSAFNLNFAAKDASGAVIVGPGTYSSTVSISTDDTQGNFTVDTAPFNAPTSTVQLAYDGTEHGAVTVTASASGATSGSLTLTPAAAAVTYAFNGSGGTASLSGSSLTLNGSGSFEKLMLQQAGWGSSYGKTFSQTNDCSSSVAALSALDSSDNLTITAGSSTGSCTVTFTGGANQTATLTVTVSQPTTGATFPIQ